MTKRLTLPPEPIYFESADFDPSAPDGHVLKIDVKGGKTLYVHVSAAVRDQLRRRIVAQPVTQTEVAA